MTFQPIIEPEDADIDCPLFRILQVFLAEAGHSRPNDEARTFMRHYYTPIPKRPDLARIEMDARRGSDARRRANGEIP